MFSVLIYEMWICCFQIMTRYQKMSFAWQLMFLNIIVKIKYSFFIGWTTVFVFISSYNRLLSLSHMYLTLDGDLVIDTVSNFCIWLLWIYLKEFVIHLSSIKYHKVCKPPSSLLCVYNFAIDGSDINWVILLYYMLESVFNMT